MKVKHGPGTAIAAVLVTTFCPAAPARAQEDPPPGDGYHYLVRARNGCGTATYGDSGLDPDPRDALDAGGPCP